MKKVLLIACSFFLANISEATELKTLQFDHIHWDGNLVQDGNRVCKTKEECADIFFVNDEKLILNWDKWGKDFYVYDAGGNKWVSDLDQSVRRKQIETEYEEMVYTPEEPFILLNPFSRTPLAAMMKFETQEPSEVLLRIKSLNSGPDIEKTFNGYQTSHEIPVLGLYPNSKNKVELEIKTKKGKVEKFTHEIQTRDAQYPAQWFPLQKNDKGFRYYANYDGIVYDEEGVIRYEFLAGGWVMFYFYKDFVFVESQKNIKKYTILGEFIQQYDYPEKFYGYMHGMNFKDNDNLLIFGSNEGSMALIEGEYRPTHRDIILEIDAQNGSVVAEYDLAEMLNPDRSLAIKSSYNEQSKVDWAHTNGIDYDAKNKAIIVSGRHLGMVKIDEKTKKPLWWLTPHQYISTSGRNGDGKDLSHLMLTAVDKNNKAYSQNVQLGYEKGAPFKWPLKSHSVKYAGSGYYAILDNSGLDIYDKKLYTTKNSVASVFYIDDKKKTVKQVFLKELGEYSEVGSSVIYDLNKKEILVSLSQARSKNNWALANSHIYRFDEKGKLLYHAVQHKNSNSGTYLFQPFEFYAPNNWPMPQEKQKKRWF